MDFGVRCVGHGTLGSPPNIWVWFKTNGTFWDRCTTRFSEISGDWDVHWGYGVLTHGHTMNMFTIWC